MIYEKFFPFLVNACVTTLYISSALCSEISPFSLFRHRRCVLNIPEFCPQTSTTYFKHSRALFSSIPPLCSQTRPICSQTFPNCSQTSLVSSQTAFVSVLKHRRSLTSKIKDQFSNIPAFCSRTLPICSQKQFVNFRILTPES
jgi:hypothetical protein